MSQTKEKSDLKSVLSRSYHWLVWKCYGIPRVSCYYFCLEPLVRSRSPMRTTSVTVMLILFESSILKVAWYNYVQSSFSRIKRDIANNFLKDTLQLNNLLIWINIRARSFIKTSVNIMKQRWMKCLEKDKFQKNSRMHFEEYYASVVHVSLILYVSFSLKVRFWI